MKIALGQFPLAWEDKLANLNSWTERLKQLEQDVDLVILPEMFTTGFSMECVDIAETMDGNTVEWMKEQSRIYDSTIIGSFICKAGGKVYNRLVVVEPNGEINRYDKRHLFSFAQEDRTFSAGNKRITVKINGWDICPLICYDLRFPVWSRNGGSSFGDYDVLVYVANWPAIRSIPWIDLLKARAHENQAYIVGVNRVGTDGNGIEYSGNSMVIDPKGNVMAELPEKTEGWIVTEIDLGALKEYRKKFRALDDADKFLFDI